MKSPWFRYPVVFLIALGWFALLQPWGRFTDTDAFYHAKMASLMLERGFITDFPWLDLTAFAHPFANQHLLFHVVLTPFVKAFGMFPGAQIGAIVFAAGCVTVFYGVLRGLSIKHPEFWTALLLTLPPVLLRLSLAKASPLAIAWFVLGIFFLLRRQIWPAFILGIVYALSHGGWPLLIVCQALIVFGEWIFERVAADDRAAAKNVLKKSLPVIAATGFGALAGLLIHPYRASIFSFLWVQVIKIGAVTPTGTVTLGQEWYPVGPLALLRDLSPVAVASAFIVLGLVFAMRAPLDRVIARRTVGLCVASGALLVLTFKSMRFAEYLAPTLVLFAATLASMVEWKKLRAFILPQDKRLAVLVIVLLVCLLARGPIATRRFMQVNAHPFDEFAGVFGVLATEAKPGERVYNVDWPRFTQLFSHDDRLKYVSGLDPTFLLERDPELAIDYDRFMLGSTSTEAYDLIRRRAQADFVFVAQPGYATATAMLRADPRFVPLYEGSDALLFRVSP